MFQLLMFACMLSLHLLSCVQPVGPMGFSMILAFLPHERIPVELLVASFALERIEDTAPEDESSAKVHSLPGCQMVSVHVLTYDIVKARSLQCGVSL